MRIRTTLSLAGRAVGAAVIGLGTLVVVGLVTAMLGGLAVGGLIFGVVDLVVDPGIKAIIVIQLLGVAVVLRVWIVGVREAVGQGRARLLRETVPIDLAPVDTERVTSTTARLAAQFDLPVPQVRHHHATTPIACTTERDGEAVLVVSSGLLGALPDAELEAVLAHELAHVANGDQRLMTWALVPLIAAEEFHDEIDDEDDDPRDIPWVVLGRLLVGSSTLGVGLFSRGREFAADRAAVAATGEPAALAAALERLDSAAAERPPEDLRAHARSVDAMSVLPTLDPDRDGGGGLFATHPATERRLERLQRLAAD
ncbi:M48 family metallopeptidase [Haloarchaeobius amylolyticus]|uniref:M48 family metallopeptidase n=1 Tax=Haloarchaeobius amylolyticus TaxID=1198296 RepID=A0ABD6BLS4_9EURY